MKLTGMMWRNGMELALLGDVLTNVNRIMGKKLQVPYNRRIFGTNERQETSNGLCLYG